MSLTGALRRKTASHHVNTWARLEAANLAEEAIYAIGQIQTKERGLALGRVINVLLTAIGDANVTEAATEKMKEIERACSARE